MTFFYLQGVSTGSVTRPSITSPDSFEARTDAPATKVSSISKTNENKGVNINRSHEVPGKYSTDGTASDAGKSGGLSLDALAKAKRALQMQKELKERMKKIPSVSSFLLLMVLYFQYLLIACGLWYLSFLFILCS